jgi:iron complex transport system permease protein
MRLRLAAALITVIVVAVVTPLIGSARIELGRALSGASPDHEILFYARLPRVLLSLVAGAALATTGVLFQALLRDPLAEPYTLGISSGASVGAVLAICLGWKAVWLTAVAGAAAALFLVLGIAFEGRRLSSFTLLLAGVTINSICFGLILFLHNLASFTQSFAISRWLMGGIDAVDYTTLSWITAAVVPLVGLTVWRARDWNLLAVGEEWAIARGVPAAKFTVAGYVAGSLMTGLVTALTGPI